MNIALDTHHSRQSGGRRLNERKAVQLRVGQEIDKTSPIREIRPNSAIAHAR